MSWRFRSSKTAARRMARSVASIRVTGQSDGQIGIDHRVDVELVGHHSPDDLTEEIGVSRQILIALDLLPEQIGGKAGQCFLEGNLPDIHLVERLHSAKACRAALVGAADRRVGLCRKGHAQLSSRESSSSSARKERKSSAFDEVLVDRSKADEGDVVETLEAVHDEGADLLGGDFGFPEAFELPDDAGDHAFDSFRLDGALAQRSKDGARQLFAVEGHLCGRIS